MARASVIHISLNRICIRSLLQGLNQRTKGKVPVVGTAVLNIAEFASLADQKDFDLSIPLTIPGGSAEPSPSLCVCPLPFVLSFYAIQLDISVYGLVQFTVIVINILAFKFCFCTCHNSS